MLLRLYHSTDAIKGKQEHLLTLCSDGPIVYEGLESLSTFALEHHAKLLPASVEVISLLNVDVEGFQEVKNPGIEHFLVLILIGRIEMERGSFPAVMWVRSHGITVENAVEAREELALVVGIKGELN